MSNSCVFRSKKSFFLREGATSVEFALVAPIVLMLFFGLVELMTCNTAIHCLNHAAYEAARQGMLPGATVSQCEERARQLVQRMGYEKVEVAISPAPIGDSDVVTATVTLNAGEVGLATGFFVKDRQLSQEVTLRRIGN